VRVNDGVFVITKEELVMNIQKRTFSVLQYCRGKWNGQPPVQVVAESYEQATEMICDNGLTHVASLKIVNLHFLSAKVWDGRGFRYCYNFGA